jgi:hypothetical protein
MSKYRQHKDKEGLVKVSSDVTEKLLSISRHLADTTQRSAGTLETLGMDVVQFFIFRYNNRNVVIYIGVRSSFIPFNVRMYLS